MIDITKNRRIMKQGRCTNVINVENTYMNMMDIITYTETGIVKDVQEKNSIE